jgi:hypothetical protein
MQDNLLATLDLQRFRTRGESISAAAMVAKPGSSIMVPANPPYIRQEAWSRYQLAFVGSISAHAENKVCAS